MGSTTPRPLVLESGRPQAAWTVTAAAGEKPRIQGFEEKFPAATTAKKWTPTSSRKIRMGIVGYGVCRFGSQFSLEPSERRGRGGATYFRIAARLAKECKCEKTYPSLEEMVKDDSIEAIFRPPMPELRHAIEALKHGKHVASGPPYGRILKTLTGFANGQDVGPELHDVRDFLSYFHADLYAMRQIYAAGGFGKLVYSEGEYFHYACAVIPSYKDWRIGLPPQWYPTHSNAYYVGVTGGSFTEVSCQGMPSIRDELKPENNRYKNPFGTEIALFRTSEGGMARMAVSWDTPGHGGEIGRVRGQRGSMVGADYQGLEKNLPDLARPPLPPGVQPGGHGGSHGYLGHEFVSSILEKRKPLVDVAWALNMTVAGIVAHQSALKDGMLMKIPQYQR